MAIVKEVLLGDSKHYLGSLLCFGLPEKCLLYLQSVPSRPLKEERAALTPRGGALSSLRFWFPRCSHLFPISQAFPVASSGLRWLGPWLQPIAPLSMPAGGAIFQLLVKEKKGCAHNVCFFGDILAVGQFREVTEVALPRPGEGSWKQPRAARGGSPGRKSNQREVNTGQHPELVFIIAFTSLSAPQLSGIEPRTFALSYIFMPF